MASPPGQLSTIDVTSIGWTFGTAIAAAVITVAVDTLLPDLKERGVIDASVMVMATTVLHALRKWLTDTRPAA